MMIQANKLPCTGAGRPRVRSEWVIIEISLSSLSFGKEACFPRLKMTTVKWDCSRKLGKTQGVWIKIIIVILTTTTITISLKMWIKLRWVCISNWKLQAKLHVLNAFYWTLESSIYGTQEESGCFTYVVKQNCSIVAHPQRMEIVLIQCLWHCQNVCNSFWRKWALGFVSKQ